MQMQLNMTLIEEAKRRIGIAKDTNNGAAVRQIPTNVGKDAVELKKGVNVDAENPYSTDVVMGTPFQCNDPLIEFERRQRAVFLLISDDNWMDFFKVYNSALLFDFDHWVSTIAATSAEFANCRIFGATVKPESVIVEVVNLWKRYKSSVKGALPTPYIPDGASDFPENLDNVEMRTPNRLKAAEGFVPENGTSKPTTLAEKLFAERLHSLYFYLWYSVLALNVDQISEFEHWIEMMEAACCRIQIENVSICVKLLAGHHAEERENFLARLRPHFQNHLARVQAKPITCECGKGMPTP